MTSPRPSKAVKELVYLPLAPGPGVRSALEDVPEVPPIASWIVTDRCNLKCVHCYPSAGPEGGSRDLTHIEALEAIDRLAEGGVEMVFLSGGEITMLPNLGALISRIRERSMTAWACTNGWFISDERAKELREAGLTGATVSIDHPRASIHDAFRARSGSHARAVSAIRALRKQDIRVNVEYTATGVNHSGAEELVPQAKRLGVENLYLKRCRSVGRGQENHANLVLDIELYRELILRFLERDAVGRSIVKYNDPAACRVVAEAAGEEPALDNLIGCWAASMWLGILPDGSITPCPLMELPIGHILRDNLASVFGHSPQVRRILDRDDRGGACATCTVRAACGGCRADALSATGDYLAEDPYCVFERRGGGSALASSPPM